jgi:hypothetical protein
VFTQFNEQHSEVSAAQIQRQKLALLYGGKGTSLEFENLKKKLFEIKVRSWYGHTSPTFKAINDRLRSLATSSSLQDDRFP